MKKAIKKKYHCQIVPSANSVLATANSAASSTCAHDEVFENMCCACGAIVVRRTGYRVSDPRDERRVFVKQNSTRALILDIDNTLLVARPHAEHSALDIKNGAQHWDVPTIDMDVVWRPGIVAQLTAAADSGLTLFIQTKGSRPYADEVRRRINAAAGTDIVNEANVISRDEERTVGKSLAHFFNAEDPHVVVMDDRVDVWDADRLYVLQVPALEWPTTVISQATHGLREQFATVARVFAEPGAGTFADRLRQLLHGREPERLPDDAEVDELSRALDS